MHKIVSSSPSYNSKHFITPKRNLVPLGSHSLQNPYQPLNPILNICVNEFNQAVACKSLHSLASIYHVDTSHFVYPLINWWTFSLLPLLAMSKAAMNIHVLQVFMVDIFFSSCGYVPWDGIAVSFGYSVSTFWGTTKLFSPGGCTILHSHKQCVRVLVSIHHCQLVSFHLLLLPS